MTPITISNCWIKARVLRPKYRPQTKQKVKDSDWQKAVEQDTDIYNATITQISDSIKILAHQARIKTTIDLQMFLNPVDKVVEDSEHQIFKDITQVYSTGDRLYESDKEDIVVLKIGTKEALEALTRLQLYEEQQNNGNSKLLSSLSLYKEVLQQHRHNALRQRSLDQWLA